MAGGLFSSPTFFVGTGGGAGVVASGGGRRVAEGSWLSITAGEPVIVGDDCGGNGGGARSRERGAPLLLGRASAKHIWRGFLVGE